MSGRTRTALWILSSAALLVCAAVLAGLFVLQSSWFNNELRRRIETVVARHTGARVSIESLDVSYAGLLVRVHGLVLRGTERELMRPFLRVPQAELQFRIISLLGRTVSLERVAVSRPEIFVLVRPDGSTNVPQPPQLDRDSIQDDLLRVAVRHFDLRDGVFLLAQRRVSFDVAAEQLRSELGFDRKGPAYTGSISAAALLVTSDYALPSLSSVSARFEFSRDRLAVSQLMAGIPGGRLQGSATLVSFSHPRLDVTFDCDLEAREAARILIKGRGVQSGRLAVTGAGFYQSGNYRVTGLLAGTAIRYAVPAAKAIDFAFRSPFALGPEGILLSDLAADSFGARLNGRAECKHFREFSFSGRLAGARLERLGDYAFHTNSTHRMFPWSGVVSGTIQAAGQFASAWRDFTFSASVAIAPSSARTPVEGTATIAYEQSRHALRFGPSHLILPQSTVDLSGTLGDALTVALETRDLQDAVTAASFFGPAGSSFEDLPFRLVNGRLGFRGAITGPVRKPQIAGAVDAAGFEWRGFRFDQVHSDFAANSSQLAVRTLSVRRERLRASASGSAPLVHWSFDAARPFHLDAQIRRAEAGALATQLGISRLQSMRGRVDFDLALSGTMENPTGTGRIRGLGLDASGQQIDSLTASLNVSGDRISLEQGLLRTADANATLSASYQRTVPNWRRGHLTVLLDTSGFQLQDLAAARAFVPGLAARAEAHLEVHALAGHSVLSPESVEGRIALREISLDQIPYGSFELAALTANGQIDASFRGNLRDSPVSGKLRAKLSGDDLGEISAELGRVRVATLCELVPKLRNANLPVDGTLQASAAFTGPLLRPSALEGVLTIAGLELRPAVGGLTLKTSVPLTIDYHNAVATVKRFRLTAQDTELDAEGRVAFGSRADLDFRVNGTLNLQLLQLVNKNVTAAGISVLNTSISGPVTDPFVTGTVEIRNASLYSSNLPNGIDQANGLIRFDRNRATIQRFSAQTGGGTLTAAGFIGFGSGTPLAYRLSTTAENVRVRYGGVSVTFDSDLRFSGTQQSSLLSGQITVAKAAFHPSTDIGSLVAATSFLVPGPAVADDFLHRVRLEVDIHSASSLQLTTSLSRDVQASVDLRLRGTPDRPALLGHFTLDEGQIQFFGSKYNINQGEVNFDNPLKIEPVLNLNLQTQARGVTINITISGTLEKLNVSYRSDPPLQSSEIIALLATGRTPDVNSSSAGTLASTRSTALATGPTTLLGSALSTPTSSRLQRFFGVTHLKIDPMTQGIESVPQARLTFEQQISRQITVTYVTNLSRTAEQIFRLEWALNPQYSIIAIRDENGLFGIDVQYKRRFK